MDFNKIKLIYSEKANQFYEPMRIDEDVGIVYMQVTKNRHDKSITKNEIIRIEQNPQYKYIVMHNATTTAEEHFIETIKCQEDIGIKLNEIKNFKRNLLSESEEALLILSELANKKSGKLTKSKNAIRYAALGSYRSLYEWKYNIQENNRKSYENQKIPNDILRLALEKRLFIERRDEYCFKSDKTYKRKLAPKQARYSIQSNFPCGFVIKNKGGYVVAGKQGKNYYTLSVDEVIDFVKGYEYDPSKTYKKPYRVPMSERKERELSMCNRILSENNLRLRNEHNYFFWVLDKQGNVIAGGKNGFGFKWLLKYCRRLRSQPKNKIVQNHS